MASRTSAVTRCELPALLLFLTLACRVTTESGGQRERLVVPGTEVAAALVVDLERGAVARRVGPPLAQAGSVAMRGEDTLVAVGQLTSGEWMLLGLDLRRGSEAWRVRVGDPAITVDGVMLGREVLAVDPLQSLVYLWQSMREGAPGIAAYDYRLGRIIAFHGPVAVRVRAMTVVPGTQSCLVIAGDAGAGASARSVLYFVCGGKNFSERDSLVFRAPSTLMEDLQWLPGGDLVLASSNGELLRVAVSSRTVVARVPRPISGLVVVSPFDGRIFVADRGSSTTASSGVIAVLSPALELSAIIDLHVLASDLRPLGLYGGVVGGGGDLLYLVGGVPRTGPLYGPQQTHVLLLDLATGRATDVIRLGTLGGGQPFLLR
ncbi:MAG TPA: hypothetical protein VNL96_07350 [Gemmatimonadaceae bacterium]|nr:hypothetical protein [Gemmatimonadaceae bacterium]